MNTTSPPQVPELPIRLAFRTNSLPTRKPQRFDLSPDADALRALAGLLDVTAVRRVRFAGEIKANGRHDFDLLADLTAQVEQPCGITLVPVQTEIRETVRRRYVADLTQPDGDEIEMPEDDSAEPLPEVIDIGAVLAEALALALPLYPRAPGAALQGEAVFGPPGAAPLKDADLRPFAGLAGLAQRVKGGTDSDPTKC